MYDGYMYLGGSGGVGVGTQSHAITNWKENGIFFFPLSSSYIFFPNIESRTMAELVHITLYLCLFSSRMQYKPMKDEILLFIILHTYMTLFSHYTEVFQYA